MTRLNEKRKTLKITNAAVASLKPVAVDVVHWDAALKGFGIRVKPSGHKSFLVYYRVGGGRSAQQRKVTLGGHGTVTADQARRRAKVVLGKAAQGDDPARERLEHRLAPTVAGLAAEFLDYVDTYRAVLTARDYRRMWEKHIGTDRSLMTRKVADVKTTDVMRVVSRLRTTPFLHNRVAALIGSFFTYASKVHGLLPRHENPALRIEKLKEPGRNRNLTDLEVKKLGAALTKAEESGADTECIAAIRLVALTGARIREIATLRWDAVNLERGIMQLKQTKTGPSDRQLGGAAMALLAGLSHEDDAVNVFPSLNTRDDPTDAVRVLWQKVRKVAGVNDARLHDWRHLHGSLSAMSGDSAFTTKTLLGHAQLSTTQRYTHADDPAKAAANRNAAAVAALLAGAETDVIPLRRKAR